MGNYGRTYLQSDNKTNGGVLLKKYIVCILLLVLIPIVCYGEGYSSMTAEELIHVMSQARAALENLEPINEHNVLYDNFGLVYSIDSIETDNKIGTIEIKIKAINDTKYNTYFFVTDAYINSWSVDDRGEVNLNHNTKSKDAGFRLSKIFESADISSFEEIDFIELYASIKFEDPEIDGKYQYREQYYILSYNVEEGIKVLESKELKVWGKFNIE